MKRFFTILLCFFIFSSTTGVYAQTPAQKNVITIPAETSFVVLLQSDINSETISLGDSVATILRSDWDYNGTIIAHQGSILYGEVVQIEKADKYAKNASFALSFNEVLTTEGNRINIKTNTIVLQMEPNRKSVLAYNLFKALIAGPLYQGLAVAALPIAALSDEYEMFQDSLPLAFGGIVIVPRQYLSKKGKEIELPAQTSLPIRLVEEVKVYL